jgi:hypothetical protein
LPGVDALGTEEVLHDTTKVGEKRGVILGWRLGVGGYQASHALGAEEVFHDTTKVGAKRVVIVGWRTGLVVARRRRTGNRGSVS